MNNIAALKNRPQNVTQKVTAKIFHFQIYLLPFFKKCFLELGFFADCQTTIFCRIQFQFPLNFACLRVSFVRQLRSLFAFEKKNI